MNPAKSKVLSHNPPQSGKEFFVTGGRKFPKGLHAKILWVSSGNFGESVKFQSPTGNYEWISTKNIEVLFPGLLPNQEPIGGWENLLSAIEEFTPKVSRKDILYWKSPEGSLTEGEVFWVSTSSWNEAPPWDPKVGLITKEGEVEKKIYLPLSSLFLSGGDELHPAGLRASPDFSRSIISEKKVNPKNLKSVKKLPPPLSQISKFVLFSGSSLWEAFSKEDSFIGKFPPEVVDSLSPSD